MTMGAPSALWALGALASAVIGLFVLRAMPRAGCVLWTCVGFLVSVWVGITLGFFCSAIAVLTVALIVVNARMVPLLPVDGMMAGFAALVLGLEVAGGVTLGDAVTAMLE